MDDDAHAWSEGFLGFPGSTGPSDDPSPQWDYSHGDHSFVLFRWMMGDHYCILFSHWRVEKSSTNSLSLAAAV